jgi:hypothetical protein
MSASASHILPQLARFGRTWWLPPGGHGNGLNDIAWAPFADVSSAVVPGLLAEFRRAGVPAYAAAVRRPLRRPGRRSPTEASGECCRIWVGSSAHSRAEETLRLALPALLRRAS